MDIQTQIDRLIELAIVQRTELKQLVEQLPELREHLNAEVERTIEEVEPQLRSELEEFCDKRAVDANAKVGAALEAKIVELSKALELTTQARYNAIKEQERKVEELRNLAAKQIEGHVAALPEAVKEIVGAELARFPRAGEIDQLRKEFAEPRGLNPRGKWQAGETYNKLDLVAFNGDSFVSNIDGNTEKPNRSSAAWTLSAARGASGGGGGITSLIDLYNKPDNGEILIGNGTDFVPNTLTAGTGITITNGAGTVTIDASGAQEVLTATVTNAESVAITRGQVVYAYGATGNRMSVKLASNTADATSAKTIGVVSDASISAGGTGLITCVGTVDKLTLGAYNEGDTLYLGATAGSVTATKPYAPNHLVYVGIVERANNGNGELYVKIQNGYELDEIHDVQINAPRQAGQTLIYDATNSLWKNARLTAGVGVSITNADSSITISADGGVNYQGTWNASTNTPTLTSSVGTKGFYYVVSVAGSTNLNGVTDWKVGDWAIFNGTAWEKVDTTDQVSSVFGRTGAVVGVSTDYSSVGITNTAIGASNPSTGAFTTLSATGAITGPSHTAPTTTDLTLSGGSSGASLVLGQGANGNATLTPSGTGSLLAGASATANGARFVLNRDNSTTANTSGTTTTAILRVANQSNDLALDFGIGGNASPFAAWIQQRDISNNATSRPIAMQPVGGNLLIGGTTDITGSGGLKVFGTTDATSTSSGSLQTLGGLGVAKNIYFGTTSATLNFNGDTPLQRTANGTLSLANTSGSFATTGFEATSNQSQNYPAFKATNNTGGTSFASFGAGGTATGDGLQNYGYIFTGAGLTGFRLFTNGSTTAKLTVDNTGNATLAGNLTVSGITQALSTNGTNSSDNLRVGDTGSASTYFKIGRNQSTGHLDFTPVQGSSYGYNFTGSGPFTVGGNLTVSGTGTSSFAGKLTATNSPASNTDATAIVGTLGSITGDVNKTYIGVSVGNISGSAIDSRQDIRGIDVGTITTSASGQYVGSQGAIVQGIKVGQITGSGTVVPNGYPAYGINVVGINSPGANIGLNVGTITGGTSNISIKTGSGVVSIGDTTDTTGAGSGALQVAGGAYVAKKLIVAENITSTGTNAALFFNSRTAENSNFAWYSPNGTTARLYDNTNAKTLLELTANTGNGTLLGSITTAAPTGGAGAWKLGVANTVSPTSPNRTITIDIGGTTYYIHAKTTND
jgi:hypothetical protein